jgi:hypothetical protein
MIEKPERRRFPPLWSVEEAGSAACGPGRVRVAD